MRGLLPAMSPSGVSSSSSSFSLFSGSLTLMDCSRRTGPRREPSFGHLLLIPLSERRNDNDAPVRSRRAWKRRRYASSSARSQLLAFWIR